MRELRVQIQDYFEESADPVTVDDVLLAATGRGAVRHLAPDRRSHWLRRPWVIAAAAALAVLILIGIGPLLSGGSSPPTAPPVDTGPPVTTVTSTTGPTVTTTRPPPTTAAPGFDPGTLPAFGDPVPLDPAIEAVLADLIAVGAEIGLERPFQVRAGTDTETGVVNGYLDLDPNDRGDSVLPGLPVAVHPTVEQAESAFAAVVTAEQDSETLDPIPLGDQSIAVVSELGRVPSPRFVSRSGPIIIDVGARPADELRTAATPLVASLLAIRDTGSAPDVSLAPFSISSEPPDTYEVAWGFRASLADRPGGGDDPKFIERSYASGVTPEFARCRFLEAPFGAQEPQDYTEWIDDLSGGVALSRRYVENDAFVDESLETTTADPRYVAHRTQCDRFTPRAADWGLSDVFAATTADLDTETVDAIAYQTSATEWVLGVEDTRSATVDLDRLVAAGVMTSTDTSGLEITDSFVTFDAGGRVTALRIDATGSRSAIEQAFGADLSPMPDERVHFSFEFEFRLELHGPNEW